MNPLVIGLILMAVLMSAGGQVLLKVAMSNPAMQTATGHGGAVMVVALLTSPWLIGGILVYGLSVLVWLAVLAKVDVSFAYPFVALGMVVTTLAGRFILGEDLPAMRLVGLAVIVLGVLIVASSYTKAA
jgi:multidrug transporter EmrE-like cation transporter